MADNCASFIKLLYPFNILRNETFPLCSAKVFDKYLRQTDPQITKTVSPAGVN